MWCYCGRNRTDGIISDVRWKTFGTPSERRQLLDAGFAEPHDLGYAMHDFTGPDGHQRSRAEIEELSAKRAESGRKGGSARRTEANASASGQANASARAKHTVEAEAEAEAKDNPPDAPTARQAPKGARAARLSPDF